MAQNNKVIIIRDAYPKSLHHYLVLPRVSSINDIYDLTAEHLPLLEAMQDIAQQEIISKYPDAKFKSGFHAIPSLRPLHLHVLSHDLCGQSLKTKHHYNSFTTAFFVPLEHVLDKLKQGQRLTRQNDFYNNLARQPLQCHRCDSAQPNMPKLRAHLQSHL